MLVVDEMIVGLVSVCVYCLGLLDGLVSSWKFDGLVGVCPMLVWLVCVWCSDWWHGCLLVDSLVVVVCLGVVSLHVSIHT